MPPDVIAPGTVSPIPAVALDDRLGFVGNTGSGKTYGAGVGVESLLADRRRVVVADPLGVWWGLRLRADGTSGGFDVVIFGGPRADVAITENAGTIIGETVATMKEPAIVDLSELGTRRAERRFMRHFLAAFYKHAAGEPVHLVLDEADMWAPQRVMDKEGGDALALLGQMETIVRRGRVKGFIPWLITQRPAVLNKDVLSQVDGLVCFKVTSPHDRKAIGSWIEGQASREQAREFDAKLPTLDRGHALVWLPMRDIIKPATFPKKVTFDSSRTPNRGEKVKAVALKPLDLGALREKLAAVETEAKANDPAALRKRIAELEREARAPAKVMPDPNVIAEAEERGYQRGLIVGRGEASDIYEDSIKVNVQKVRDVLDLWTASPMPVPDMRRELKVVHRGVIQDPTVAVGPAHVMPEKKTGPGADPLKTAKKAATKYPEAPPAELTGPETRIINALAFWDSVGEAAPTREQVAAVAGYKPNTGSFNTYLSRMKSAGIIDYPGAGTIKALIDGHAPDRDEAALTFRAVVGGPGWKILRSVSSGGTYSRDDVAKNCGYLPNTGSFNTYLSRLKTLGAIDYPAKGMVQISEWTKEIIHA